MVKKKPSQSPGDNSADPKDTGELISRATGPRTTAGKSRVRDNALKHGVFSSRLVVSDQDKETFDNLQDELSEQLRPNTAILQLAFQRVLTAAWRYRQAIEMESGRLRPQLNSDAGGITTQPARNDLLALYRGGRQDLNQATRFLVQVRQDVAANGGLHLENMREAISKTFGAEFFNTLADWTPKNTTAVLGQEMLVAHAKEYGGDLKPGTVSLPLLTDRARWDMSLKLIDQELQHINDLRVLLDNPSISAQQEAGLDTFNRYITSAAREFERAVAWYFYLQEQAI